jgi:hypothetical protein
MQPLILFGELKTGAMLLELLKKGVGETQPSPLLGA